MERAKDTEMNERLIKTTQIKKIENKLYLELSDELLEYLDIKNKDGFIVIFNLNSATILKATGKDIPIHIESALLKLFNHNANAIIKWLYTPKSPLEGAIPVELLDSPDGCKIVLDLIKRIEQGDFS